MGTAASTTELVVDLADRSYPVYIGRGLLQRAEAFRPYLRSQAMIVTNETIAPLYLAAVNRTISQHSQTQTLVLPDGEQYKTLDTLQTVVGALLAARMDRDCVLIALGGGVIGDIVGFAAACYQRGVDFIQIPTTLLAQVDSSVGGKTAVNHALGKNMIGAFHQPRLVVADTATLDTLPDRELHAGLAEVIKYGLIRDRSFFCWLEANIPRLLSREPEALVYTIHRSCANKAAVVAADEREAGERALLNLGHTFGHAIETGLGYGTWLHGEAVAAGMCLAADLSQRQGWLDATDVERIRTLMTQCKLPNRSPSELSPERMLELMSVDKKAKDGHIRLILLRALGEAILTANYSRAHLLATLAAHGEQRI